MKTDNPDQTTVPASLPRQPATGTAALLQAGRWAEAAALLAQPSTASELEHRALCEFHLGHWDLAKPYFELSVAHPQAGPDAHANYAYALFLNGDYTESETYFERTLEMAPCHEFALTNFFDALFHRTDGLMRIEQLAQRAMDAGADQRLGKLTMAKAWLLSLRQRQAFETLEGMVPQAQTDTGLLSQYLGVASYCDHVEPARLARGHRALGRVWARRVPADASIAMLVEACEAVGAKRLRVGILTADAGTHPIGQLLTSFLPHLDATRVEVTLYSTHEGPGALQSAGGEAGAQARWPACEGVVQVAGWSDEHLATRIRADSLHVLVDAIGLTSGQRLGVLARRCAPVQLGWAGYIAPTGLPTMDGYIADTTTAGPGAEALYGEPIMRLPSCVYCYEPVVPHPPVAPLPALRGEGLTFGSFNNLSKVNESTLDSWAAVLNAVPRSRMVIKASAIADTATRDRLSQALAARGIDPKRLHMGLPSGFYEYLADYAKVDIALDPMPFNGGVTSLHALWQGVPVLTLPGESHVSRVGASLMQCVGLLDFVAKDLEDFARLAARHASDLPRLAGIRAGLRQRLGACAAGNGAMFARDMTGLWERAWLKAREQ